MLRSLTITLSQMTLTTLRDGSNNACKIQPRTDSALRLIRTANGEVVFKITKSALLTISELQLSLE